MTDPSTATKTTATEAQIQQQNQTKLIVAEVQAGSEIPATNLIYMTWEGNFQLECRATVLRCNAVDNCNDKMQQQQHNEAADEATNVHLCFDQTVLHAQGGGQPTDFGMIRILRDTEQQNGEDFDMTIRIHQVLLDRATGIALHTGRLISPKSSSPTPSATSASRWLPNVGDQLEIVVDADRRRILSECHTAGHVVDAAMARCELYLPPSKAYHYLEGPYVEYQGSVSNNNQNELLANLQQAFCQLVEENVETKIELVSPSQAQAMCHPLVASQIMVTTTTSTDEAAEQTQPIRIVTVAGWPCPCGGTHVKSTGELSNRKWNITGIKSKKGVVRVKYHYQVKSE